MKNCFLIILNIFKKKNILLSNIKLKHDQQLPNHPTNFLGVIYGDELEPVNSAEMWRVFCSTPAREKLNMVRFFGGEQPTNVSNLAL